MKLIKAIWECEECGEQFEEQTTQLHSVKSYVSVCIDFAHKGNPWVSLCPKCIDRLEQVWPKLVARFRDIKRES